MGMFDDVLCEAPLPDGYEGEFQTKDLECTLTTYKITTEGRLLSREYEWEDNAEAPLGFWRVAKSWSDIGYHGFLNFYGSDDEGNWDENDAKFTDGDLIEITLSSPAAPDTEDAKERA